MPLIQCPDCRQEVTDREVSCPKCGFPIQEAKPVDKLPQRVNCLDCTTGSDFYAEVCPKCGLFTGSALSGEGACACGFAFDKIVVQETPSSKAAVESRRSTAGILALLLGGIGIHHFYLDRPVAGLLNILFCWTFIPAILAIVTAIQYFSMTDDNFNRTVDKSHLNFGDSED